MRKKSETIKAPRTIIATGWDHYFPSVHEELRYDNAAMEVHKPKELQDVANQIATGAAITLTDELRSVNFVQNPYTDVALRRQEAAVRRNWSVRSAIGVREHFVFGKGSQLVIELAPEESEGLEQEQITKKIEENKEWKAALKAIQARDNALEIINPLKTFYWQSLIFGRGCILKIFNDDKQTVRKLKAINSRRLGDPIIDSETDDLAGVIVDGQALKLEKMIYAPYRDLQLSPHTEYFGYSALETISHAAETLNIAVEEDLKEMMKSAWLASILLKINTEGLGTDKALQKITSLIDAIKPGKIMGTTGDTEPVMLDLHPNFEGMVKAMDKLEQIIYKTLQVPQFLVQNEGVANRATAIQSAQLFLDGVISADQEHLTAVLDKQWYEPQLRIALRLTDPDKATPIIIRRKFNTAKIAEFIDLSDAVTALFNANIIDLQKALELLDMKDVWKRKEAEENQAIEAQKNNAKPSS